MVYHKPRITFLLQCNPSPHLFSSFTEHSPNVFFFLSGFSEEHPQSVAILRHFSFLLLRVLPVETLSSSIGSSPSSEGVLIGSGGCSEHLGLGLSALSRATSIFGICTRYVIGVCRSIGGDGYRSILASEYRSTLLWACRWIQTLSGLGECGCFAANSSSV
ncbi:hypothetical protein F2Q69_00006758 [Brassica cretica]|uniref:Uncharacterized protein n=1 Tax=Brassica cretica TaxID=69181 RepID=A0A8S9NR27_BRACR|nr:hypothetical protein F2Q69_00006758 [Brassica cretica]